MCTNGFFSSLSTRKENGTKKTRGKWKENHLGCQLRCRLSLWTEERIAAAAAAAQKATCSFFQTGGNNNKEEGGEQEPHHYHHHLHTDKKNLRVPIAICVCVLCRTGNRICALPLRQRPDALSAPCVIDSSLSLSFGLAGRKMGNGHIE